MKLGIISGATTKEELQALKDRGLEFVEYCVNFNDNDNHVEFTQNAEKLADTCKEVGIEVGSVGRWGGYAILPDGSLNPAELKANQLLIEAAKKLGSPVFCTGCNYVEELSLFENYSSAINHFSKLIEFGKEHGVKIATVNCHWNNYVHSDPAWSVIHGHLNDLYIKYDPSHAIYAHGDYRQEMVKWGERFAHVHIKGSLLVDGQRVDDPPAGLDGTNWGEFMGLLYSKGYDKTLSIEPHSSVWHGDLGTKGTDYTIKLMKTLIF